MQALLDDLLVIRALLRKHRDRNSGWLGRIIEDASGDEAKLAKAIDCVEFWGGPGSLADEFLVPRAGEPATSEADRSAFYAAMCRAARKLEEVGIVSDRARRWSAAFEQWCSPESLGRRP